MSEKPAGNWAPWWVYVVLIVGCNYGKQALIGGRVPDAVNVVISVALAAVLVVVITAGYRAVGRSADPDP